MIEIHKKECEKGSVVFKKKKESLKLIEGKKVIIENREEVEISKHKWEVRCSDVNQ